MEDVIFSFIWMICPSAFTVFRSIAGTAVTPYNLLTAFLYAVFGFFLSADATLSLLLRLAHVSTLPGLP